MLIKLWGAEKVLSELISLYPDADVFTLMYDEKKVGSVFPPEKIHCTWPAQWFFRFTWKPRASLLWMPFSIRMIDVSEYDLVISSSSGFAHWVKRWTLNVERWNYQRSRRNLSLSRENSILCRRARGYHERCYLFNYYSLTGSPHGIWSWNGWRLWGYEGYGGEGGEANFIVIVCIYVILK